MTHQEAAILVAARAVVPLPHGVASAGGGLTIEAWPQAAPYAVPALCIREGDRVVFLTDMAEIWVYHPGDWERQLLSDAGGDDAAMTPSTEEISQEMAYNLQQAPSQLWTGNSTVPGTMPAPLPPTKQRIIDASTATFQASLNTWHGWQRQRRDGNG